MERKTDFSGTAKWVRDPRPITVKISEQLSQDEEITFRNESCIVERDGKRRVDKYQKQEEQIFIHEERVISGKLCVKRDGSVFVTNPGDPNDASCKCAGYEVFNM